MTSILNPNYYRLNKIGKSPLLVSKREDLASDCKQINDLVSALSAAEADSVQSTVQGSITLKVSDGLGNLGKLLAFPGLAGDYPNRARSQGDLQAAGRDPATYRSLLTADC